MLCVRGGKSIQMRMEEEASSSTSANWGERFWEPLPPPAGSLNILQPAVLFVHLFFVFKYMSLFIGIFTLYISLQVSSGIIGISYTGKSSVRPCQDSFFSKHFFEVTTKSNNLFYERDRAKVHLYKINQINMISYSVPVSLYCKLYNYIDCR